MPPKLEPVDRLADALQPGAGFDALLVVAHEPPADLPEGLSDVLGRVLDVDRAAARETRLIVTGVAPGERLVWSPTGSLGADWDDVRRFGEAAAAAVMQAVEAGATAPFLAVFPGRPEDRYVKAVEVAVLGALAALWQPLEAREALGAEVVEPVRRLGFLSPTAGDGAALADRCTAVEAGRRAARDLTGAQPERITPRRFADYCRDLFEGTEVEVEVVDDLDVLRADYPLLLSVARASLSVPRHHPCVVRLSWASEGPVEETLLLAGKGVTYDTGGADLKTGGHMAGMSRDKGGAAAVAGFVAAVAALKPKGLAVRAELGLVRNSVGAGGYVTDEIVVSHAGTRVRVGNTDAEGRLVMADLLSHLRGQALSAPRPRLLTVATLTGHAVLSVGPYTIAMDNGPARAHGIAEGLAAAGERWGEPVEISRLRREDLDFVKPRTRADDVLSANSAPSSRTPRGHQFPMAFLLVASGLEGHGRASDQPLAYTHLDIAGSATEGLDVQHGRPTGAPVLAMLGLWAMRD